MPNEEEIINPKTKLKISLPIIFFVVAGFIGVISTTTIILPKLDYIDSLKTEISEEEINLKLLKNQLDDINKKQNEINENKEEVDFDITIPKEFDITSFFETIDFFTHESKGYKLTQITLNPPIPSDINQNVNKMKFTLNIEATPNKVIDLINSFENDKQLFTIENVDIDNDMRVIDDTYTTTIKMSSYYLNNDQESEVSG